MGMYASLADVLEYPSEDLSARLDCATENGSAAVVEAMAMFRDAVVPIGLERLQEMYTSAFDMDADCALYAGHQLFGATERRSMLMACLAAEYREAGIISSPELPDYLPTILRYIDRGSALSEQARDELIALVLLPAMRKVADALEARRHPYALAVRAVLTALGVGAELARPPEALQ